MITKKSRLSQTVIFILTILSLFLTPMANLLCAQSAGEAPSSESKSAPLTKEDIEAFLDGLLPAQLDREDIAGAVVSVVKDGQVLFTKGYGYSDYAKKKPISPQTTMFRPGSVSKLFTWTAVMQLVEQGKLDLDTDVNNYIDFKIPATFSKPVTLRNLMTHSGGFEESIKDLFAASKTEVAPLSKYLPTHIPERIYPPGVTPAYSNYGTALAGYIVERASGKPFAVYIEEEIFKPLGMSYSTFEQPLPDRFKENMSQGYKLGSQDTYPFEMITGAPAGSLSSSAMDMSNFMIAHLQKGRFGDQRILQEKTAELMHARQLELDPDANAMALGFYEESRNGLRIIGHGGDTVYFHSDLHLIPEHNLGFYVSYNSGGKGEISGRSVLWEKFLDRYFPYTNVAAGTKSKNSDDVSKITGAYLISRRSESNLMRLPFLMLETKVTLADDGTIQVADLKDDRGNTKKFREIKPRTYQEVDGQDKIMFHPATDSSSYRLIIPYPFMVFDKVAWYQNSRFLIGLSVFVLAVVLLTLIFWPINALVRRHYGKKLNLTRGERRLRFFTRVVCVLILLFLGAYGFFVANGFENISGFSTQMDIWLRLLQIIGVIAALGVLLCLFYVFRTWSNPERRFWPKLHALLLLLACIGFIWILVQGKFLTAGLQY